MDEVLTKRRGGWMEGEVPPQQRHCARSLDVCHVCMIAMRVLPRLHSHHMDLRIGLFFMTHRGEASRWFRREWVT